MQDDRPSQTDALRLSVIVCTCNRAESLARTIAALQRQTLPPPRWELIVVDDGSTDDTAEVCRRLQAEIPMLRCVSAGCNGGLARARNLGVAAARAERIAFTDDDCLPHPDWAARMAQALEESPVVAGAVASPTDDYFKLCHNVAQFYGMMPCRPRGPVDFLAGANMGFRRAVIEEIGGFREAQRNAEDMEFMLRARRRGYRAQFEPEAVVVHDPSRTHPGELLRYAANHAAATIHLRRVHRDLLRTPRLFDSPALLRLAAPLVALKVTWDVFAGCRGMGRYLHTLPMVYATKVAWCFGAARGLRRPPEGFEKP